MFLWLLKTDSAVRSMLNFATLGIVGDLICAAPGGHELAQAELLRADFALLSNEPSRATRRTSLSDFVMTPMRDERGQ
jgi:hypothetical protein